MSHYDDTSKTAEVENLREMLESQRKLLRVLIEQESGFTSLYVPPHVVSQIKDLREKIRDTKNELLGYNNDVEHNLIDFDSESDCLTEIERYRKVNSLYNEANELFINKIYNEAANKVSEIRKISINHHLANRLMKSIEEDQNRNSSLGEQIYRRTEVYTLDAGVLKRISEGIMEGNVFFILGSEANSYGRLTGDGDYPLSERELMKNLSDEFKVSLADIRSNRYVAQYLYSTGDRSRFYNKIHTLLMKKYKPTLLHQMLVNIPEFLHIHPIIITTGYDNSLEDAFLRRGQNFNLIEYRSGNFWHKDNTSSRPRKLSVNNKSSGLKFDKSIIIKVFGTVNQGNQWSDDLLITEDDHLKHIVYNKIPMAIRARMINGTLLFLGCDVQEWNFRNLVYKITEGRYPGGAWFVSDDGDEFSRILWEYGRINPVTAKLDIFIQKLQEHLGIPPLSESAV